MPLHPAWAKNITRRVLWAALETDISKADRKRMAEYFGMRCIYCDSELGGRWHADHLLSVDQGGLNHLSNRVPSCAKCNEKEKREMAWAAFLALKCAGDRDRFEARKKKIDDWVLSNPIGTGGVSPELRKVWQEKVQIVSASIDAAWDELRAEKKKKGA